jgi:pyruvate dehydrogenase E2 component (dihydrolipoyllysine-residue acetyltransferase)
MADLIMMPKLGFDMAEGTLVEWTKKVGDAVAEGDVIATIETDKANVEVTSFKAGVIRQLLVEAGTAVPVNTPIAIVGAADEPLDLAALGVKPSTPAAKPEKAAAPAKAEPAPVASIVPTVVKAGPVIASPVARRMADELGIDLHQVTGSGPEGRIVKRDIEEYVKQPAQAKVVAPPPIPTPSFAPPGEGYRAEPLTPMRQTIARRMTESKQQAPHFYITMDVDMAAALDLRKQLNALLPETESVSVNDLLVKAAAIALKQFPHINASFAGNEIRIHDRINIGIAVSREVGLVTTVLQDADKKSLAQIAKDSREIIARAREGRMRAEEMVGGTLNISNLGMYGVEDFIAIISPPQAAVLAIGAIQRVPVVDGAGQLAVGTRMKVTISADHRVTDGAEAARFLQAFKAALEQPMRLVL